MHICWADETVYSNNAEYKADAEYAVWSDKQVKWAIRSGEVVNAVIMGAAHASALDRRYHLLVRLNHFHSSNPGVAIHVPFTPPTPTLKPYKGKRPANMHNVVTPFRNARQLLAAVRRAASRRF